MKFHYRLNSKKVFVAGHKGMVGSAVLRRLKSFSCDIITADRQQLDLLEQRAVQSFLHDKKPDCIIVAAARVGGILENSKYPVDFLYQNMCIQNNLIMGAHLSNVERLLFMGSSCIYPKFSPQPMKEDALLTGPLEPTNEWYAIAKIAGIKLCDAMRLQYGRSYISAMPTNLYGPNDNFNLQSSHVLPALLRKAHTAKLQGDDTLEVWGSGNPKREFMHVDDLADALIYCLQNFDAPGPINIGVGKDLSIGELASLIAQVTGFEGKLIYDASKPDGTPRKLMDVSKLTQLGWTSKIGLEEGVNSTYKWFLSNVPS